MVNKVHVSHFTFLSPLGNNSASLHQGLSGRDTGVRKLRTDEVPQDFPIQCAAKIESPFGMSYSQVVKGLWRQMHSEMGVTFPIDAIVAGYRELNSFPFALNLWGSGAYSAEELDQLRREKPLEDLSSCLQESGICLPEERQVLLGNACATGASLLGMAFQRIRMGLWQRALILGIELDAHPLQLMNIFLLGALSGEKGCCSEASRPFSASRQGFVKGESAVLLLLESEAALRERQGRSFGEIVGYGNTSDAWNLVEGRTDGSGVEAAMRAAIEDAALQVDDIDYVKAHATGTSSGDAVEVGAIQRLLGEHCKNVYVNSLKSKLGHSTIASGLMEFICVLHMQMHGYISPNLNTNDLDPDLLKSGLRFVGEDAIGIKCKFVLLNSIGFGGQNASLVVKPAFASQTLP